MDAHRGGEGEEGASHGSHQKTSNNWGHKNAIKHKNRRPPLDFLTASCTPSKEFKMTVHL
jgi:hypothetical protein